MILKLLLYLFLYTNKLLIKIDNYKIKIIMLKIDLIL